MMSRSAWFVGLMAALLGGKAVVMPGLLRVAVDPGGMTLARREALQAATAVYSDGDRRAGQHWGTGAVPSAS